MRYSDENFCPRCGAKLIAYSEHHIVWHCTGRRCAGIEMAYIQDTWLNINTWAPVTDDDLDEGTELWDPEKMDLIKRKCGFCKKDAIIVNKKLHHWMKTNETDWGCVKLNRWEGQEKFLYLLDLCRECVKMHKDLHQEILND